VYLAGAMQAAPDSGKTWRTKITPRLEDVGYKVFNPCLSTDGPIFEELGWKKFEWSEIKKPENRELYKEVMNRIVKADLAAVTDSDVVVCYWDQYVPKGAGTQGELTLACFHNLPVYIVMAGDMSFDSLPGWVVGCATEVFSSFTELIDFLEDKKHEK
jgi:hypothetical protein